jgi:hypothetical protein
MPEFLNPKGLFLLTGLIPLIALYILKTRRKRLRLPSTLLWQDARRDHLARAPFRRLLPEASLLLQILALVALAIALARPTKRGSRIVGDHIAIVMDVSASMGAVEGTSDHGERSRLDAAKEASGKIVNALGATSDAFIVEASREARLTLPPTRDRQLLSQTLSKMHVHEVEGRLSPAVAMAVDRLRSLGGKGRLIVITDGSIAETEALVSYGVPIEVLQVGAPHENLGIVRLDVRAGIDPVSRLEQTQAFVSIRNYSREKKDVYVTVTLDGDTDPIASRRMLIDPEANTPAVLTFEPPKLKRGKGMRVNLSPTDALAVDNVAYARVPPSLRMPVTLATHAEYTWFTRALDADKWVDLQRLTLDQLGRANVDADALVIVEHACPAQIPGQSIVVVAPPPGRCFGVEIKAPEQGSAITSWDTTDSRLRFLSLEEVQIGQTSLLETKGGGSLARIRAGTVIADASVPGRSVTVLGFAPGESNWPLKASFVLFVRNLVETARNHRERGTAQSARTGEPLSVPIPRDTTAVTVTLPGGERQSLVPLQGTASLGAPSKTGAYRVKWELPHTGEIAVFVNLLSEAEGQLAQRELVFAAGAAEASTRTAQGNLVDEWTRWLALVALVAIVADVLLLTRAPRPRSA